MDLDDDLGRAVAAAGARAVVTGASGWLGRVTCDILAAAGVPTHAYAHRARDQFRAFGDLGPPPAGDGPLLVFHYAFLTKEKVAALGHQAYAAENVAITSRALDWVARERPAGIFVASSGAAAAGLPIEEDPYGALKRLDELAFSSAAQLVGARLRIARVYNVAGLHITTPELYALGNLVGAALRGDPLRISAQGDVVRSYVAVEDLVSVALAELLAPGRPDRLTFDTAGTTVEISELAEAVRSALGRDDLRIERTRDPQAPRSVYVGDGAMMADLLKHHGLNPTPLCVQIRRTAESLR